LGEAVSLRIREKQNHLVINARTREKTWLICNQFCFSRILGRKSVTLQMAIAGRSSGGRPLRRRRELVLMSATDGCEGPQPSTETNGPLLADSLEGARFVGAVK
jgi:hypothetical protein